MDLDEMLIKEVRSRAILYDIGHPDYKDLKKTEYAWRDVAENIKLNEIECEKRWKGLCDSYKCCKWLDQIDSGSKAEPPKKVESLSFLENATSSRRTVGNISEDEDSDEGGDEDSDEDIGEDGDEDNEKFQEFLDLASTSISKICTSFAAHKQDSTSLHFQSLASKIKEANMPPNLVNQIESKVSILVFGEIEKFYSTVKI